MFSLDSAHAVLPFLLRRNDSMFYPDLFSLSVPQKKKKYACFVVFFCA